MGINLQVKTSLPPLSLTGKPSVNAIGGSTPILDFLSGLCALLALLGGTRLCM